MSTPENVLTVTEPKYSENHLYYGEKVYHTLLEPILKVYSVQLLHGITFPFSKYFQILYIFVQIFKYFALFQHFFAIFLKNYSIPLLSRIGFDYTNIINQHTKLNFYQNQHLC